MRFKCEKSSLQDAISIAQKAVTGKANISVLEGIYISAANNQITLIGSDTDLCIETKLNGEVMEEGKIVVDSKIFGEIIRKLPNAQIEIATSENNSIEITCQKSDFTLIYMSADDYPSMPSVDENQIFSVSQAILKNMIRGTAFAIAQDETRPVLTGVLFEVKNRKLNLVALDGYRLALKSEIVETDSVINAVIPGKTLSEVSKILEETENQVKLIFATNHILFDLGKTKIISRLLEGEFIKYESIIPKEHNSKVTTKKSEILNCIERASLMAKEGNTNLIKFNVAEDNIVITSNSQLGKVREELNVILQGEALQIAFNSKYLIDVLKIMEEDEIVMELTSSVNPCILKNKNIDNCTYLVLPVRLLNN